MSFIFGFLPVRSYGPLDKISRHALDRRS